MLHHNKATGLNFDVSQLVDYDGSQHDISVITLWNSPESGVDSPVTIIDYYFGDYDAEVTDKYIKRYFDGLHNEARHLSAATTYLNAYTLINSGFLEEEVVEKIDDAIKYANNRLQVLNCLTNSDWVKAERIKQLLTCCMMNPGAKITITVEHDNGRKATADLYDHAALTQSLYDTLEYFQSEL